MEDADHKSSLQKKVAELEKEIETLRHQSATYNYQNNILYNEHGAEHCLTNSPFPIVVFNKYYYITAFNKQFSTTFHLPIQYAQAQKPVRLLSAGNLQPLYKHVSKHHEKVTPLIIEINGEKHQFIADTLISGTDTVVFLRDITSFVSEGKKGYAEKTEYNCWFDFNLTPMLLSHPSEHIIMHANKAACIFFGHNATQLTGLPLHKLFDIANASTDNILAGSKSTSTCHVQVKHKHVNGNVRDVAVHSGLIEHKGKILTCSVIQNISDHLAREKKPRNTEHEYRLIVEKSPFAIIVSDIHGKVHYLNKKFSTTFGLSLKNCKHLEKWWEKTCIDDNAVEFNKQQWQQLLKQVKAKQKLMPEYGQLISADNSIIDIEITYTPVGKRILIIINDLTEFKKAKKRLEESEEKYRKIFQLNPMPVAVNEAESGIFTEVNESFVKASGYTRDEVLSKSVSELGFYVNPGDGKTFLKAVLHKSPINQVEVLLRNKCGNIKNSLISAGFFKYKHKKYIVSVLHDITNQVKIKKELIKAKNKAEQADKLKSAFLANMGHEIRTPLNGMLGFAELLRSATNPNATKRYIDIIISNGEQLLSIISDIIDIAKIEANQITILNDDVLLNNLLTDIHLLYKSGSRVHTKPNIRLALNISDKLNNKYIKTDPIRLKQVFINLLNNAYKFTEQGSITYGYTIKAGELEFFVADTGCGIPPEKTSMVFERYAQVVPQESIKKGGSGLGLAICKAIINKMGGTIWIESNYGKGSTFKFTIPFEITDTTNGRVYNENTIRNWSGKTILIAEDEETNQMLLESYLEPTQVNIIMAVNGRHCLELFKKHQARINVVLLDIKMPFMSGYEVINELQKINKLTPVIAQTAYAMSDEKKRILEAGCTDYISKPLTKARLLNVIDNYI